MCTISELLHDVDTRLSAHHALRLPRRFHVVLARFADCPVATGVHEGAVFWVNGLEAHQACGEDVL